MSLPINIHDLLQGKPVEWERLEFKEGWNPEAVLHTLCAFANDIHNLGGGYILIGIAEHDGRPVLPPVGLDPAQLDAIQKELLNLFFNVVAPYHPIAVPVEIDGRSVLVLWALGGPTRPYKAKVSLSKDSKEYAYYIRKHSSTIRAKGPDEAELLSLAATVPFDDRFNPQAKVEDLSRELMQDYLNQVGSDLAKQAPELSIAELGRQMGVVGGPEEAPFPLNVGLMMFNPEPWRFFPVMQIDVVWFPKEGPGGNKFSEKIFKGPIPRMTRDALDYIKSVGVQAVEVGCGGYVGDAHCKAAELLADDETTEPTPHPKLRVAKVATAGGDVVTATEAWLAAAGAAPDATAIRGWLHQRVPEYRAQPVRF